MITFPNTNIKTSIFYINDVHGKSINMERLMSANRDFNIDNKRKDTDKLTLSSGDIMLGEDVTTNKIAIMFQKMIKIGATALGNHEYDLQDKLNKVVEAIDYPILADNVNMKKEFPYSKKVKNYIVINKNGNRYGVIGTTPLSLLVHSKDGAVKDYVSVNSEDQTVENIQKDVNELEKQGINKVILLSHLGNAIDKKIAKKIQGVDIILGGHSHDLITGIKENENLFYSKKGEPIVITQAGRDGKNFGILNLEFDKNGIIKKVQNNIGETKQFSRFQPAKYIFDKLYGPQEVYGVIKSVPQYITQNITDINPNAYFIADSIKNKVGCDIAMLPAANIRGYFEKGNVDDRIISDILPFKNKIYVGKYSEKVIVDIITKTMDSFKTPSHKPGLFYFSGLKYTITKAGEIESIKFIDKDKKEINIDVNNPNKNKFYNIATIDYYAMGNDNFSMLSPDKITNKFEFNTNDCVKEYFKLHKDPVSILDDERIIIK